MATKLVVRLATHPMVGEGRPASRCIGVLLLIPSLLGFLWTAVLGEFPVVGA